MLTMITQLLTKLSEPVVLRHVAYRCGCVRTFDGKEATPGMCPEHKAGMTSHTEELVQITAQPSEAVRP